MPYTPAYNALFAKPLLNQLIAIIQRDQAAAIAIVNSNLSPINEFHKGSAARTAFPWLMLAGEGVRFGPEAQSFTRHQTCAISLMLDVAQFDQEQVQDNAQDYARMLDIVITTATRADWETPLPFTWPAGFVGTTTPNASGSVKDVWIESHTYTLSRRQEIEVPILTVTLQLLFDLEET